MSKEYKDFLDYRIKKTGLKRRENISKEAIGYQNMSIDTLLLEDYDNAFKDWVDNELSITFEEKELPTISLFANQRFSEYMQSWSNTDNKKNLLMNFKVITRNSNPKPGTMYGDYRNVPEDKFYLIKRIDSIDENGRPLFLDYCMKQPYCEDIEYRVGVVTNKFRLLNKFNEIVNEKFKSINQALNVKGNLVTMILNDISDETEYKIDDRQYYLQVFTIVVRGFIVRKEDIKVKEVRKPKNIYLGVFNDKERNNWAEIEDGDKIDIGDVNYQEVKITIQINRCKNSYNFKIDESFIVKKLNLENTRKFSIKNNGKEIYSYSNMNDSLDVDLRFKENDVIDISNVLRINAMDGPSVITMIGYNPYKIIK